MAFSQKEIRNDELREPKAGVVYLSASSKAPIVPVGIYGLEKAFGLILGIRPKITVKIGNPLVRTSFQKIRLKKKRVLILE